MILLMMSSYLFSHRSSMRKLKSLANGKKNRDGKMLRRRKRYWFQILILICILLAIISSQSYNFTFETPLRHTIAIPAFDNYEFRIYLMRTGFLHRSTLALDSRLLHSSQESEKFLRKISTSPLSPLQYFFLYYLQLTIFQVNYDCATTTTYVRWSLELWKKSTWSCENHSGYECRSSLMES